MEGYKNCWVNYRWFEANVEGDQNLLKNYHASVRRRRRRRSGFQSLIRRVVFQGLALQVEPLCFNYAATGSKVA